jgi:DNA-binding beta-propeller fold protein YncE
MRWAVCFWPLLFPLAGCGPGGGALQPGFGERGLYPGQFVRPRALAALPQSPDGELYCIDFSGRIQVFDLDGRYRREWKTPTIANGRPCALALDPDGGKVVVADSHYQRVLIYTPAGAKLASIDGMEPGGPGPLGYIAGVAVAGDGSIFFSEFSDNARIHRYSAAGKHLLTFGSQGAAPGQFARPRGLAIAPRGELLVADSCNHRLQRFSLDGKLLQVIGKEGTGPGEFRYPYGVTVALDGSIFTIEYGNHRVQKFNPAGEPVAQWGQPGRGLGMLHSPWGICVDGRGVAWVADTENHRLQRIR